MLAFKITNINQTSKSWGCEEEIPGYMKGKRVNLKQILPWLPPVDSVWITEFSLLNFQKSFSILILTVQKVHSIYLSSGMKMHYHCTDGQFHMLLIKFFLLKHTFFAQTSLCWFCFVTWCFIKFLSNCVWSL